VKYGDLGKMACARIWCYEYSTNISPGVAILTAAHITVSGTASCLADRAENRLRLDATEQNPAIQFGPDLEQCCSEGKHIVTQILIDGWFSCIGSRAETYVMKKVY
jgi:hypothetical protein